MLTLVFFSHNTGKKLLHRVLSNPDKLSSFFVFLSVPEASCSVSRWRFWIIQSTHQRHRYDTALNRPTLVQTRKSQILRPRNTAGSTRLLKHSWEYKRWDNVSGMSNTPFRTPPSCTLACMQHTRTKNTYAHTHSSSLGCLVLSPASGLGARIVHSCSPTSPIKIRQFHSQWHSFIP